MKNIIFIITLLYSYTICAQLENSNWVFGLNNHLTFNDTSNLPTLSNLNNNTSLPFFPSATVSDNQGNLLFYCNSFNITDRNGNIMPNGDGLIGFTQSSQGVIIVKKPGSCNNYYVFTTPSYTSNGGGYYYSEVDMTLNGGLGNVINGQKNIPLNDINGVPITDNKSERISSYTHPSINHTWVVIQHKTSIYSYRIDNNGVNPTPVQSVNSPSIINDINYTSASDFLKISPNGNKLIVTYSVILPPYFPTRQIYSYDFDYIDGSMSTGTLISSESGGTVYGIDFSPSGNKLYYTSGGLLLQLKSNNNIKKRKIINPLKSNLYQYDFNSKQAPKIIAQSDQSFKSVQRAYDGKIYISKSNYNGISVLHAPESSFGSFQEDAFQAYSYGSVLPQWVYKSDANSNDSWALDFGLTFLGEIGLANSIRKTIDVETDDDGNIYIYGYQLNQLSQEFQTLVNNANLTYNGNGSFIAKFNSCKELIDLKELPGGGNPGHEFFKLDKTNNIIYLRRNNYIHKIDATNLNNNLGYWSRNYTTHPTDNYLFSNINFSIDPNNGNTFLANSNGLRIDFTPLTTSNPLNEQKPLISLINPIDGGVNTFYEFNLGLNQYGYINNIVVKNNNIYVAGELKFHAPATFTFGNNSINVDTPSGSGSSLRYTSNFIARLNFNGTTFTPLNIIEEDNQYLEYNETNNILYATNELFQKDITQMFIPGTGSVKAYNQDLSNNLFNISTNDDIADVAYNSNTNSLYVATYSTNNTPNYLRKYNANTGTFIWQTNETFGNDEYIADTKISFHNNNVYLTGLYKANNTLAQTNLPNSVGQTDIFSLLVKDQGNDYGYRIANNGLNKKVGNTQNAFINRDALNNSLLKTFTVFPNPFNNSVSISTSETDKNTYTITISDLIGTSNHNSIFNTRLQKQTTINTSYLPKGVYALSIQHNGKIVYTTKLIK